MQPYIQNINTLNNFIEKEDLVLSYQWKLDYLPLLEKFPINYTLKHNQIYKKYSETDEKRTFWIDDLQYQYEVKKIDDVFYYNDLTKEDFIDPVNTHFGHANTFS